MQSIRYYQKLDKGDQYLSISIVHNLRDICLYKHSLSQTDNLRYFLVHESP